MIPFFPVSASTLSPQVDLLFSALLVFSFGLGSFLVFLVLRFSIVYRSGSKADRSGSRARDPRLESIWIVGAVLFAFAMFAWGAALFLERDNVPAGAMQILGIGKQWMWKFEHANGRREINTLHVPVDQPVVVTLGSQDVIHSLYLPEFRIKQDAVPGQTTRVWFEATRTGTFDLFCAEYCGDQHSEMRGSIVVMEKADFAAWLGTGNADLTLVQQGEALFPLLRLLGLPRPRLHPACTGPARRLWGPGAAHQPHYGARRRALHPRLHPRPQPRGGRRLRAHHAQLRRPDRGAGPAKAHRLHQVHRQRRRRRAMTTTTSIAPDRGYFSAGSGIRAWLLTTDHKRVAWLYLISLTAFFFIGGAAATLMRLELVTPQGDLVGDADYNRLFTLHGIIMVWFFLVPSIPATLGNFLLPLMLGARDLAFPGSTSPAGTCSCSAASSRSTR